MHVCSGSTACISKSPVTQSLSTCVGWKARANLISYQKHQQLIARCLVQLYTSDNSFSCPIGCPNRTSNYSTPPPPTLRAAPPSQPTGWDGGVIGRPFGRTFGQDNYTMHWTIHFHAGSTLVPCGWLELELIQWIWNIHVTDFSLGCKSPSVALSLSLSLSLSESSITQSL
jgi:hypothetical protein